MATFALGKLLQRGLLPRRNGSRLHLHFPLVLRASQIEQRKFVADYAKRVRALLIASSEMSAEPFLFGNNGAMLRLTIISARRSQARRANRTLDLPQRAGGDRGSEFAHRSGLCNLLDRNAIRPISG